MGYTKIPAFVSTRLFVFLLSRIFVMSHLNDDSWFKYAPDIIKDLPERASCVLHKSHIPVLTLLYSFQVTCASTFSFRQEAETLVNFGQAGIELTVFCVWVSGIRWQQSRREEIANLQKSLENKTAIIKYQKTVTYIV